MAEKPSSPEELLGNCSVWRRVNGQPQMIEGDLPEEIALQMVADYEAEGETVWMERVSGAK